MSSFTIWNVQSAVMCESNERALTAENKIAI